MVGGTLIPLKPLTNVRGPVVGISRRALIARCGMKQWRKEKKCTWEVTHCMSRNEYQSYTRDAPWEPMWIPQQGEEAPRSQKEWAHQSRYASGLDGCRLACPPHSTCLRRKQCLVPYSDVSAQVSTWTPPENLGPT